MFMCCVVAPSSLNYWSSAAPAALYPSRIDFGGVYDPSIDATYVIAGVLAPGVLTNDSWITMDRGSTWVCQSCQNTAPGTNAYFSARFGVGLAVGPAAAKGSPSPLYLLGGTDSTGTLQPELWNSTDQGVTWTRMMLNFYGLHPKETPNMFFDSNGNMWVATLGYTIAVVVSNL